MTVMIEDALRVGALARGKVVAGQGGLRNVVEHVTVMEVPPPMVDHWLHGGELLLTTFYCVRHQPSAQVEIIKSLTRAGSAGLVFHPGAIDVALAPEALTQADRSNVPIITVPADISYVEIMTPLLGTILNQQTALLQRSHDIHQQLIGLLLRGAELHEICSLLSQLLRRAVLIVDAAGRSLAGSSAGDLSVRSQWDPTATFDLLAHIVRQAKDGHAREQRVDAGRLVAVPISTGRRILGMVVAIGAQETPLDPMDLAALEQAALAVALHLVKDEAVRKAESRLHADFVDSLLGSAKQARPTAATASTSTVARKHVVLLLDLSLLVNGRALDDDATGRARDENDVVEAVRGVVREHAPNSIVALHDGHIVLLPELQGPFNRGQLRQDVTSLLAKIRHGLGERLADAMVVACGGVSPDGNLKRGYGEAVRALDIRKTVGLTPEVVWYDDVRFFDLLLRNGNEYDLRAFCEATIAPLAEYDKKGSKLVETMESYLDSGMRLQETSIALHLHPNAVKYRLSRVRDILGVDPFSPEHHLTYHIATKLLRLVTASFVG